MPIIGRIAKPLKSETVQEGIAAVSDKGMELYEMVVAKVMKEGKKIGESGRVDSYKHPDRPDITVDVNQTDGSAEIYFDTDRGSKGYAKIDRDMETGGTDLQEAEEIYKGTSEGDYYKDIDEGISGGLENLEEFTRIKKAMGGRVGYQTGGRATTRDFTEALRRVSAGTTNQQQAQAKEYARNEAANELSRAIQAGNFDNFIKAAGPKFANFKNFQSLPTGSYRAFKENLIGKLADEKLDTTFFGSNYDPMKEEREALEKIKLENQRLFDEYIKNNPPQVGVITGPTGKAPTKPTPAYEDQTLLDRLTMLTPLQATNLDPFDQLSDIDQYNLSLAYPELKSQLRNPNAPRLAVMPDPQNLFSTRYGIVSGQPMIPNLKDGGSVDLTIITMPDISGSGVESLFKTR
jgi:hypothetical protein